MSYPYGAKAINRKPVYESDYLRALRMIHDLKKDYPHLAERYRDLLNFPDWIHLLLDILEQLLVDPHNNIHDLELPLF